MTGPGQDEYYEDYSYREPKKSRETILAEIELNIEWHIRERKKDKKFAENLVKFIEKRTGLTLIDEKDRYEAFLEDLVDFLQINSGSGGDVPYGSETANEKYRKQEKRIYEIE